MKKSEKNQDKSLKRKDKKNQEIANEESRKRQKKNRDLKNNKSEQNPPQQVTEPEPPRKTKFKSQKKYREEIKEYEAARQRAFMARKAEERAKEEALQAQKRAEEEARLARENHKQEKRANRQVKKKKRRKALAVGGGALAGIIIICAIASAAGNSGKADDYSDYVESAEEPEYAVCEESAKETETTAEEFISLSDIPEYEDSPYVEINGNIPFFDEDDITTEAFEIYSDLDDLGRCGAAYANICEEIMPTEERGDISSITPTGWQSVQYDIIDENYLYNRCHLIGYQLAGENANELNLITGTRYLNVEGMLPFENMVADYVEETGNHVLYRVTPLFDSDNLVASGVLMEAMSVEDEGEGILFCIYCYNVQPGIIIDYATGDSCLDESETVAETTEETTTEEAETTTKAQETTTKSTQSTSKSTESTTKATNAAESTAETYTYVLNTNTKKFHYQDCRYVKQMSDENKYIYSGTRDEVIAMGYDACKVCCP